MVSRGKATLLDFQFSRGLFSLPLSPSLFLLPLSVLWSYCHVCNLVHISVSITLFPPCLLPMPLCVCLSPSPHLCLSVHLSSYMLGAFSASTPMSSSLCVPSTPCSRLSLSISLPVICCPPHHPLPPSDFLPPIVWGRRASN